MALAAVIDGLLAKDVADRMDSAAARAALLAAARPRARGVYRVPLTSRRAYTGHRSVEVLPSTAVAGAPETPPPPPAPDRRRARPPRRRRVTILTAGAALLVPLLATLASAAGGPNSAGLAGRADAAVLPAPPGVDPSAAPPGGARALGMPGFLLTPPGNPHGTNHDTPPGGMVTDPVSGTTRPARGGAPLPGTGLATEPSGGGGGENGGTTPPPAAAVTGLTVALTVDPTACTYSASALVTVSAATTVTYRVTWTDGAGGTTSTEFAAAGGGSLDAPSSVAHGAGPVWVQVEVLTPTAVTQRDEGELPASCTPTTPTTEPDPSPMISPSSPNPAGPADQNTTAGEPTLSQPAQQPAVTTP
jgi:hypothetical protein